MEEIKESLEDQMKRRRRRNLRVIFAFLCLLVVLTLIQNYIQGLRTPSPVPNSIVVFALFNLNILLLMVLVLLVLKNLVTLYFERKKRVIGARFRTKLVIAFVGLALIPSVLLFIFASGLITTSIENWFSSRVEESLDGALEVARSYYSDAEDRALFLAKRISRRISSEGLMDRELRPDLEAYVKERLRDDLVDGVQIFDREASITTEAFNQELPVDIFLVSDSADVTESLKGTGFTTIFSRGEWDVIAGLEPIVSQDGREVIGSVVVSQFIPKSLVKKMKGITTAYEEYKELKILKRPLKASYVIAFLMITLLIMFSAIWFAFYLAKGITIPIQELAEATRSVAGGNLDVKIASRPSDEVGILVESFNKMTRDLKEGKEEIERASEELRISNIELDQRRIYMETVLENVSTGVVSIDSNGYVITINKSASALLGLDRVEVRGKHYTEVFEEDDLPYFVMIIEKVIRDQKPIVQEEVQIAVRDRVLILSSNCRLLKDGLGNYLGLVVVFDDLTELISAQRVAAWREAAKRIAHEIKNPLTPIQLSAQRLRKKFRDGADDFGIVFEECTTTIIEQVEGMKRLVNEFSKFARLPEVMPRPCDLNRIIEDTILLYNSSHAGMSIEARLQQDIPIMNLDKEQIQRVFINLFENSMEAMENGGKVLVTTALERDTDMVRVEVRDEGRGIPAEMRGKLFLPYFSTKREGTGLGLAIVNRVISDHNGYIRVKDNHPQGTVVTIELPVASGDFAAKI